MTRILFLVLFLALAFGVGGNISATDYYVATWGDNNAIGDLTHPWQNVSYATQQAVAGDTIYLFDGTWYDEHAVFANSGNATHPITLTAYNGTPILDGEDMTGYGISLGDESYISVSNLEIRNYVHTICDPGSYIHISSCKLWNTTSLSGGTNGVVVVISGYNSTHNIIEDCELYNSGWNTIQLIGNREPPAGNGFPSTDITIRNCTIYNSASHTSIDFYGNIENVTIEDCEFYNNPAGCVFTHDPPDHQGNLTIRDNNFHDTLSIGLTLNKVNNCEIYNNTFTNLPNHNPIYTAYDSHDFDIYNNSFYNCTYTRIVDGYNFTFDNNYVHSDSSAYSIGGGVFATIKNPRGNGDVHLNWASGVAEVLFDDGTVFTASYYWLGSHVPVRIYPTKSNTTGTARTDDWGTINTITKYNVTLKPTSSYLMDVVVNHESDITDDRTNIAINSNVENNPTWINTTMQNASNTYNVSVDGGHVTQIVSGSDKVIRYQYTSSWSPHTFEIDWFSSDGFSGAPDAINIANTTGTTWVHHTWSAGTGDITDSYNISVNDVWYNTSPAYHNNSGLSAESWSNITVFAYNTTGGISADSINQDTRSGSNATSVILVANAEGADGNSVVTTETMANGAFGAATLAGGQTDVSDWNADDVPTGVDVWTENAGLLLLVVLVSLLGLAILIIRGLQ